MPDSLTPTFETPALGGTARETFRTATGGRIDRALTGRAAS